MEENGVVKIGSNIQKRILTKGKLGRKPSIGWTCCITLHTDNPNPEENLEIIIGDACSPRDRLIETCIQSMHLEEKSSFTILPEAGEVNFNPTITLNSFKEKPYIFQWTEEEKLEASKNYKARGAELYKENKIEEAFHKFSLALKFVNLLDAILEEDEPGAEINDLRVALYNNIANCHLNFKNYESAVKLCSNSISVTPTTKALYRRAVAYIELKNYDKAEGDLTELLKIEPKNKAALEKYKLVRSLDKVNRDNYKSMVKKMFG